MKYWLTFAFLLFSFVSHAQNVLVLVTDSDGYANIRENPKADAKVVGTIKSGEFAYCGECKDYWCKVSNNYRLVGYIHKSRIEAVTYLPDSIQRDFIITTFKQLKINATNFNNAYIRKDSIAHLKTVKILEAYEDERYTPILDIFPNYFCRTKDTVALGFLFDAIASNMGSANEAPAWALGYCFKCQSDLMLAQLGKVSHKKHRKFIAGFIDFGLRNILDPEDPKKAAQLNALEKKLEAFLK